jgi:SAM-dependent methyltransferase
MSRTPLQRRASRALERQLAYQQHKAGSLRGREAETIAWMEKRSREVREKLDAVRPISDDMRVLEVGSGAHGLIFYFGASDGCGVDPLADEYKSLFAKWQAQARTIAAFGEQLPFEDESFDVVLCDNVVDHAESPRRILEEIVRVLAPGGLLYFTVNVHHPFYHWAATAHSWWRSVGIPLEITPFADHTVHLTVAGAQRLFKGLPLTVHRQSDSVREMREAPVRARHFGDQFKRLFFKNANWELIAIKAPDGDQELR